ncbi:hypothetical protein E2C01_011503 [Portunus trituberculatus]|uniref:Uncharacterized protein n=1 Tax=Portunus trituberculatus TaxID=210409 RepID=A0A5B7DC48_PORTR|nr:hypothetical protein [Portunus trituberculatus]
MKRGKFSSDEKKSQVFDVILTSNTCDTIILRIQLLISVMSAPDTLKGETDSPPQPHDRITGIVGSPYQAILAFAFVTLGWQRRQRTDLGTGDEQVLIITCHSEKNKSVQYTLSPRLCRQ